LAVAVAASAALALAADNTPPEGFELLFNGKDLAGWKGLVGNPKSRAKMTPEALAVAEAKATERARQHWKIVDGALEYDGKATSLCTAKDYADFELYVDWRIPPGGDSGLYLRGTPQVQIWDLNRRKEGSGGLFNNKKNPSKPLVCADNPIGEWNTFYIKMVGERVTVKLNGKLVVDNVVMENYWERAKPIYPKGQIELQHHGSKLWFKNIYIKELPGPADR
jgi:hypothetical protein